MEKPDFAKVVEVPKVPVLPRTLGLRPMEYKHPLGVSVYFAGVFGRDQASPAGDNDVWVATFFDTNEAEAFILASKTFGQEVIGVRLTLTPEKKLEVN